MYTDVKTARLLTFIAAIGLLNVSLLTSGCSKPQEMAASSDRGGDQADSATNTATPVEPQIDKAPDITEEAAASEPAREPNGELEFSLAPASPSSAGPSLAGPSPGAITSASPSTERPSMKRPSMKRPSMKRPSTKRPTAKPPTVRPPMAPNTMRSISRGSAVAGGESAEPQTGALVLPDNFDSSATASISVPAPAAIPQPPPTIKPPTADNHAMREGLPAGATRESGQGFATIRVFYATDRAEGALPLSAYELTGHQRLLKSLSGAAVILFLFSAFSWIIKCSRIGTLTTVAGTACGAVAVAIVMLGHASIEKRGVTYTGDRGLLTRGICEVTVPDGHQRGQVERPSLLRFEFHEDQQEHIVLTSAVELPKDEFEKRLSDTVASSVDRDLLVFIHGYNVDFQSAIQRTAQIAVDLPFEGVPVCYSWPSQAKLLGYSVDENNSQWTVAHLKEFLLELAEESGAQSINVVAHSMGNRAMTAAMQQIQLEQDPSSTPMFDRLVLAAPDVDADLFRKDLAPSLLQVANQVTLYASSDDQALIASKRVHGYPRAGESGRNLVVMPGIETIDVSGIDLSLLGHSYYGDNESMLQDLYQVVRSRLRAPKRGSLIRKQTGSLIYWQLAQRPSDPNVPVDR